MGGGLFYRHHKLAQIDEYKETLWRYPHNSPMDIRSKPTTDSPKMQQVVLPGGVVRVLQEVTAKDGSKHLQLANGGWIPEKVEPHGQVVSKVDITARQDALNGFQGGGEPWEFFLEWGWTKYDLTNCKLISAAFSKNLAAVDSPPDAHPRIVFDLVGMQQINMHNGKRRAIRRGALRKSSSNLNAGTQNQV